MAFKTLEQYNEEKYGGWFILKNDGDYADVIFLYPSCREVLVADTHYVKSPDYNGYVHCCGHGCPACAKNIRVQTKLFIPMYNLTDGEIQFWDRSARFETHLSDMVFSKYPNPADYVFRITRHGEAGSMDTKYEITAIARNSANPYSKILADNKITFPEGYEAICKSLSATDMYKMLNASQSPESLSNLPDYQVTPRGAGAAPASLPPVPEAPAAGFSSAPEGLPEYTSTVAGGTDLGSFIPQAGSEVPFNPEDEISEDVDF